MLWKWTCDPLCVKLGNKNISLQCLGSVTYFALKNPQCWREWIDSRHCFQKSTGIFLYFLVCKGSSALCKQASVNPQCPYPKHQHLGCHKKELHCWMTVLGQDPLIASCRVLQSGHSRVSSSETSGREQVTQFCDSLQSYSMIRIGSRHKKSILSIQWHFLCWIFSLSFFFPPLSHVRLFVTPWTVHGILQAKILEWAAFPCSRGFSQPRDRTQVSCIADGCFTSWATRETQSLLGHQFKNFFAASTFYAFVAFALWYISVYRR